MKRCEDVNVEVCQHSTRTVKTKRRSKKESADFGGSTFEPDLRIDSLSVRVRNSQNVLLRYQIRKSESSEVDGLSVLMINMTRTVK